MSSLRKRILFFYLTSLATMPFGLAIDEETATTAAEATAVSVAAAPEPSRQILLIAGICFVLVAYRKAWYNLRKR